MGMLGHADPDNRIAVYRKPTRRHAPETEFNMAGRDSLPRVDIIYSYAGAEGDHVTASIAGGAKAIVALPCSRDTRTRAKKSATRCEC